MSDFRIHGGRVIALSHNVRVPLWEFAVGPSRRGSRRTGGAGRSYESRAGLLTFVWKNKRSQEAAEAGICSVAGSSELLACWNIRQKSGGSAFGRFHRPRTM
eukprot:6775002-Prymnesium_polylepis.1